MIVYGNLEVLRSNSATRLVKPSIAVCRFLSVVIKSVPFIVHGTFISTLVTLSGSNVTGFGVMFLTGMILLYSEEGTFYKS